MRILQFLTTFCVPATFRAAFPSDTSRFSIMNRVLPIQKTKDSADHDFSINKVAGPGLGCESEAGSRECRVDLI